MKSNRNRAAGFSLIEVMIAVVVLAVGLISLAALQARLFQSGADSKARAGATSLAQQALEEARSFAFVTAPIKSDGTAYTGNTYVDLETTDPEVISSGGVTYTLSRTVKRYVFCGGSIQSESSCAGGVPSISLKVPEFKHVKVNVGWTNADGSAGTVTLVDSIAAISPADAANLRKVEDDFGKGPKVYLTPPSDPYVMPIGLGDNQEAASSNPQPNQVIQDVAAATTFSVMTYTNDGSDGVLLGRKLDVAGTTCLCQADGTASREAPVYAPVIWSGRQQIYMPPKLLTETSIRKGKIDSKLDNSEIKQLCTICCRDHHESSKRIPRPDPWRVLTADESTQEHYGYQSNGNQYKLGALLPLGSSGVGSYVESCQLVRVDGQMRLAVDARQANMLVTPLSGNTTSPYDVVDFKSKYGQMVGTQIADTIGQSANGGFPPFVVPADSNLRLASPVVLTDTSPEKRLAAFGLYVDYLTDDTIAVYQCIAGILQSTDSRCSGLVPKGPTAAMTVLPFYAVNVANLGEWRSGIPEAIGVHSANFRERTDGGRAYPGSASSLATIPVTFRMNNSNSGLASTLPIDTDDKSPSSFADDKQDFKRDGGTEYASYSVSFSVEEASSINLSEFNFVPPKGSNVVCQGRFSVTCTQPYLKNGKPDDMVVAVTGYNATPDFKICLRNPEPLLNASLSAVSNSGLAGEATEITVSVKPNADGSNPLNSLDHPLNLYLAVIPQAGVCP